jgi:hypothetical protein
MDRTCSLNGREKCIQGLEMGPIGKLLLGRKKTPWFWSASELYRPTERRLLK